MKIVELKAENVKRLKAVHIKPDGSLVVVGGKNAAGKSSVLDSIEMALGGKSAVPGTPVHRGAEKGRVVVDLGDLIVTRRFTAAGGTSLAVETPDGAVKKSPQAILDALVGRLSFDPLAFKTMKPAEQYQTLQEVLGLDFAALEDRREAVYSQRTTVNREVDRLKGELQTHEHHEGAPEEEVSVAALSEELTAAQAEHEGVAVRERNLAKISEDLGTLGNTRDDLDEQIAGMELSLAGARGKRAAQTTAIGEARKTFDDVEAQLHTAREAVTPLNPIRERLSTAEDTNRLVRENVARRNVATRYNEARDESEELTRQLVAISDEKQAAIAGAEFPVEGLNVADGVVLFSGLPFDQASDAEKLRVSVAMAIQMNPKLRVLLIRDGSLLDADSLRLVAEMAAEASVQVWMERVGEDEATSVVIEDGEVAAREGRG